MRTRPAIRTRTSVALGAVALAAVGLAAPASAAPTAGAVHASAAGVVTLGGKCLDDANQGTANGNAVQLYDCNGSSAQNWTWSADGTVTDYGKCLDITGGSDANGALLQLYACTASAAQQKFTWLPDGTVYSSKSGKCLAVQGGSAADAARIGLAPCDPSQPLEVWNATTAPPPKYTLSAGTPVSYANPDDTPASVYTDANGQFYYQQSHSLYGATDSRQWSFYSGSNFDTAALAPISTSVNPANKQDSNGDTTWRCNNSPTGVTSTYAPSGSGYAERNYCDLSGTWVDPDTGWWYGLVHNEFTPQPFGDGLHYDAIDYAVSKDHGATWSIAGHAVTSPYSTARDDTTQFPNQTYYYGDGDQRLFVDYASGYFYAFYATRVLDKSGGGTVWLQHVARAPISQKMATSSWRKWYDGAWQSPGVGGAESDIIPAEGVGSGYVASGDDYQPSASGAVSSQVAAGTLPDNSQLAVMNVAWDAYLGKYIGTPQNNVAQATNTLTPLHFYTTDDLATQKWTDMGLVSSLPNAAWYRWFLDSSTLTSSTVVGKTFRSYCAYYCSTYTSEYSPVTIAPQSSSALPAGPVSSGVTYEIGATDGRYLAQQGSSLTTVAGSGTSASQMWKFTPTGDGFFTMANAGSGRVLGVPSTSNAGRAWDASVTLGSLGATATTGQQWSIQTIVQSPAARGRSTATGVYRLVNRYSGLALSLTGSGSLPVATAPQRGWDNPGTAGDTRPASAQALAFTAVSGSPGNAITVTSPGNQTSTVGTPISPLQITASDSAAGQHLTYAATGLPAGLAINAATGRITGTPTGNGATTAMITATDATGATGNATFTWTVVGTDLALGKPTTASSAQSGGNYAANLATDGNPNTRWSSTFSDPQWLQVDLGATHSITEVKLAWEAAYAQAFQLQTSTDGSTWTTIYSTTTGSGGTQDLTGLSGSGRYIRMYGTARGSGYGYSLWSFEVYGS
ncbi:hypothetical protein ABH920_003900 [Catenulispora sp. EB89]|uniref:discoidin domain-containing protein n=1 Tax=Catenulispora sp. EB89 TaxID=3156257 RepID=UPI00351644AF